jgi:hypothetical protein
MAVVSLTVTAAFAPGTGRSAAMRAAIVPHTLGSHVTNPAAAGPFVTLLFSRTELTAADGCIENNAGIARLDATVAPYMRSLGLTGTGTLVTGKIKDAALRCTHKDDSLMGSWADAARLAASYGWSFVSHTATYPNNVGSLPPGQAYAETCGSAAAIDAHGLPGGHGLIAYPGAQPPPEKLQATYGARCFAWGRRYGHAGLTSYTAGQTPPYWQNTAAFKGGPCNAVGRPCYTINVPGSQRYKMPGSIITELQSLRPGQWLTLQSYLLVKGTNPAYSQNGTRWDCSSSNPALHWTNDVERYCYSDFQQITRALAATPSITVTDPLTVGESFGRSGFLSVTHSPDLRLARFR